MSENLCMGCMNPKGSESVCPRCGYDKSNMRRLPALKPGTMLDNRYLVGAARKMSGEGITYIAMDENTGRKVILREFLPPTVATRTKDNDTVQVKDGCEHIYRDYLSDFLEISRAVSRLSDISAIVPVLDIFESNNTAYAVYEFVNGKSFRELIERAKRLTWDEARPLFMPLISAMSSAHAIGLVHFGISPDCVMITREGNLLLTDFGIPDARIAETELNAELNDGFSALEQYSLDAKKGKWTDVYAMCALLLYALTGKCPPSALNRAEDPRLNVSGSLAETIPTHVLTAIAGGLQVESSNRIAGMDKLRAELGGRPVGAEAGNERGGNVRMNTAPQRPAENRTGGISSAAGKLVSNVQNAFNQNKKPLQSSNDSNEPWYKKLTQFQYGLISACLSIIVLGTIAVIVFINIRPLLNPDGEKGPNVEYVGYASDSDMAGNITDMHLVPDFTGVDWETATNSPDYLMFQLLQTKEDHSDDYDVGQIIGQSVKPGTEVPYGTPIAVTISLGSKTCAIPNILNMTVSAADAALIEAGLRLGNQTEEYNDSVPAGCIIAVSGAEIGSRLTRGSAINVVVSLGPEGIPAAQ